MADTKADESISAAEHAQAMASYIREGNERARALGNRGPIRLGGDGKLAGDIIEAYWQHGFYVFENVISNEELAELRADVERILADAPTSPAGDTQFALPSFRFEKPLSDPYGGTTKNKGRHPVKMLGPKPGDDAPDLTVANFLGNLQLMPSCLNLYGHHGLLTAAESIMGADFVPYNEVTFVKEPALGPSVAWHQDGTTHWDAPDWDQGAHGYNSMAQLYPSTAGNCVWVLPGTHKLGKVDIKQLMADSGSERLEGAVPMLCEAGDVFITNRQLVHGSFANSSPDRRITLNAGFFPRRRVQDVTTSKLDGTVATYDGDWIDARCRMIPIAVDARQQRFPDEPRYTYQPLAGQTEQNRWNEQTQQELVRDYNLWDFYI